MEGYI